MGPGAIDLTIEASGAPTCIQIGVHVLKPSYVLPSFYILFIHPLHVSETIHLQATTLPSSYRSTASTSLRSVEAQADKIAGPTSKSVWAPK
jgi:hypothetical protein